jgi:hypothetical protein
VPDRPFSRQNGVVDGVHLDDEAHRDVLVHLVLQARQRRHERDAVVEHRREREDRLARAHGDPSAMP